MNTHANREPTEGELHEVFLSKAGSVRVDIRLDDSSHLIVDFQPESDGFARIIDALTKATTQTLSSLGARGLIIIGTTAAADGDEDPAE